MNKANLGSNNKVNSLQKPKNTKYVIKRLWDYLYTFKWLLLIALGLTIAANYFSLIGPKYLGEAINAIKPGKGKVLFSTVYYYAVRMLIFFILSSLFSYILSLLMIKITQKVIYKMRTDAFDKIESLPISYFDNNKAGDIISRLSYDIDTINTSLSTDLIQIVTSLIIIFGSLAFMISISPVLVLVFVVTIPISLIFTRFMMKKTRVLFRKRSAKLGELNGFSEEMISGMKTIKAYSREKDMLNNFDKYNKEATDAAYNAEYYGSVSGPFVNFINNLSISLVCIFGALLNIYRGLSIGDIASFILYSRKFSGPINEIANILSEIQSAMAAAERVLALIDAKPESEDKSDAINIEGNYNEIKIKKIIEKLLSLYGEKENAKVAENIAIDLKKLNPINFEKESFSRLERLCSDSLGLIKNKKFSSKDYQMIKESYLNLVGISKNAEREKLNFLIKTCHKFPLLKEVNDLNNTALINGDVEFKDVEFGYTKERKIIKDLSFKAHQGEVIAIVGPTGAGKTTIVNLLMRFYDIDKGQIYLDKFDILDITRKSLRLSYAMVLQDTWLFQGTVFQNVSYGKEDATIEEVINACKAAKIHHFVSSLPNGYDTVLIEGGINISKGQKQLLTIARAMLLDAKMLILDEATSNVDTRTEIQIQEAMKKLMQGKTCFIIAHRLSTIRNADLILVVKDGNIIEQGSHEALLNNNGFYSEMYNSQFN